MSWHCHREFLLLPAGPLAWVVPEWQLCLHLIPSPAAPTNRWECPQALTLPFQDVNLCGIPNFPVSLRLAMDMWGVEKDQSPGNAFPCHPKQPDPNPSTSSSESRAWHYCQAERKMRLSEPCLQYLPFPVTKKWKSETFGTETDRLLRG